MANYSEIWHNFQKDVKHPEGFDMQHERILQPFEFEKMNPFTARKWVLEMQPRVNWLAFCYVLFAFIGPRLMRDQKPWNLRKPLIIWNCILAVFSICGTMRMAPTLLYLVLFVPDGSYKSICQPDYVWEVDIFWGQLFAVSKIFELIDTVFIVLRKSPLIFLHWFHHATVMLFCFYLGPTASPIIRVSCVLNYSVHSIMYTYYALRMMGVKIPKAISKSLTSIQILQFVAAIVATFSAVYYKLSGSRECILAPSTIVLHFFGAFAYLTLFADFFYKSYIVKRTSASKIKQQ